ncbi:MAG: alcohol dehydrogenase, partial [Phycisphaerae bacterium]
ASPNSFEQTLRLMNAGRLVVSPLVTHVLPLEEAAEAFAMQENPKSQRVKIHLVPPN